jgi:hypothetical protein
MLIYEQQIQGKGVYQVTHNMSELSSGIYFVRYIDAEIISTKTIVKK